MRGQPPARGGAGRRRSQPRAAPVRGEHEELEAGDKVEEDVEDDEEDAPRRAEEAGQQTR